MFQLPKYVHQQLHAHAKVIDNGDERLVIEKKLGQINKEIDHVVNNNENATIKETKKDSTVVTIEKTTQEVVDVITNTDESSDGK
jgi:hypothetical protein